MLLCVHGVYSMHSWTVRVHFMMANMFLVLACIYDYACSVLACFFDIVHAKYRHTSAILHASCWYASPLCRNASAIVHVINLKLFMLRDDIHLQLCMPRTGCAYGTCYVLIYASVIVHAICWHVSESAHAAYWHASAIVNAFWYANKIMHAACWHACTLSCSDF